MSYLSNVWAASSFIPLPFSPVRSAASFSIGVAARVAIGQSRDRGDLAKKLPHGLGWRAGPPLASGNIGHHASCRRDLGARADRQMSGDARLTAEGGEIADGARSRDAGLRDQHSMAADDDVVADLHQIVDLRPLADDSVAVRAAVNCDPGADLDVVLNDYAADLRHLEMPSRPKRESEAVLSDMRAGMNDHPVADQRG